MQDKLAQGVSQPQRGVPQRRRPFPLPVGCGVKRTLSEAELDDFQGPATEFRSHLYHHRKHIDVNTTRIVAGLYPAVGRALDSLARSLEGFRTASS